MQVIPPVQMTDARLTSTTIPEEVAATYAGGTTYAAGDRAGAAPVYGAPQTVWESLQAGNTGNTQEEGDWWTEKGTVYPVYDSGSSCDTGGIVTDLANHRLYISLIDGNTGKALTDTESWADYGPTNAWAMFDLTRNTQSIVPLTQTVVFAPGVRVNSICLAGMSADAYSIVVNSVSGGGEVANKSGSLTQRDTAGWSDYFFGAFGTDPSVVFFDIPLYSDCIFTVTVTSTTGNVALGALVVGSYVFLGDVQYTAVSDVLNFSTVDRSIDGTAVLTPRRNIPKTRQRVLCQKSNVNKVRNLRELLNATPAIWFGIDDGMDGYFESLFILGIYKSLSINVDSPEYAILNIELEEI